MAEILIKIGDGSAYADGDLLCAFNRRRIRCCHAQGICHPDLMPFNENGLRPPDCVMKRLHEETYQYKFTRISRTRIERLEIATGIIDTFGPESIDVPLFLTRRKRHKRHAIYGASGREFWYGGNVDLSDAALDRVWQAIETKTPHREADSQFQLWPMGRLDIRHHLAVRTTDFTDVEAEGLVSPRLDITDPENPVEISKRNIHVDWVNDLLPDLGVTESQVRDRNFAVGRELQLEPGRLRYQSKEQPQQSDRSKLQSKETGRLQ